jgi:ketosteroid isomerase-like protein
MCGGGRFMGTKLGSAAGTQSDEQAIRALQARMAAAGSARDLDAVMKEYIPGSGLFVFDSDLPRQHVGWDAYRADSKLIFDSAKDIKAEAEDLGVTVDGNAAYSHNLEHLTWTRKSDGSTGEQLMSATDGYRMRSIPAGAKWRICSQSFLNEASAAGDLVSGRGSAYIRIYGAGLVKPKSMCKSRPDRRASTGSAIVERMCEWGTASA